MFNIFLIVILNTNVKKRYPTEKYLEYKNKKSVLKQWQQLYHSGLYLIVTTQFKQWQSHQKWPIHGVGVLVNVFVDLDYRLKIDLDQSGKRK